MKIIEDDQPEGRRCQRLFRFRGFPIGDPEFEGFCVIKARDQEHAEAILARMLRRRGLSTDWPHDVHDIGEITPPPRK